MSATRLAIMAGLLTHAFAPESAPAARTRRPIEATPARGPRNVEIAQIGGDFFIAETPAAVRSTETVTLGNTVRIDQRILAGAHLPTAGDSQ